MSRDRCAGSQRWNRVSLGGGEVEVLTSWFCAVGSLFGISLTSHDRLVSAGRKRKRTDDFRRVKRGRTWCICITANCWWFTCREKLAMASKTRALMISSLPLSQLADLNRLSSSLRWCQDNVYKQCPIRFNDPNSLITIIDGMRLPQSMP